MSYKVKLILYLITKLFLIAAAFGILYSAYMLFTNLDEWIFWLAALVVNFILLGIFIGLYILRKSKFPLPGIDYK